MNKGIFQAVQILFVIFIGGMLALGCTNTKRLANDKPLRNRTPGFLVKKNEANDFIFDWLGLKVSAEIKTEGESDSFKATLRMKKDSVIWLSISPALGVEMVRMIISPDSVKYISKVPNNKHYYLGDFKVIEDVTGIPFNFQMIQNMIVGNAIMLEKGDEKFISMADKQQYLLISKIDRKLKKVLGYDEKDMIPNTVVLVEGYEKEYQKAIRRSSVDELMCKRFWLNAHDYRLERSLFNDVYNLRDIEIIYSDTKYSEGMPYSTRGRLKVTSREYWQELSFKISRLNTTKTYDFPFEVPEEYERKY